jgi:predicted metal-dependent HD superfamily phosphohydrolase
VAHAFRSLDQTRWSKLWSRLGARGAGLSVFERLTAAYTEPTRAYHNTEHIRDCLAQLDGAAQLARRLEEAEAALWFHDAVYVAGASDNEERSAHLANECLAGGAVEPERCRRIVDLILATRHSEMSDQADTQLVCDIDLSILGRDSAAYDEFERQIRREYGWVPEAAYRRARSQVLAGFLSRRFIYQTASFRHQYEEAARRNLERRIAELAA